MRGSGNCYKPALLMHQLGIGFRLEEVDIVNGASRTDAFIAMNPNGKVTLLQMDDGRMLAESNAILCFLADGSTLFPDDRWQRAQILQWLFFEQYSHETNIATRSECHSDGTEWGRTGIWTGQRVSKTTNI